MASALETETMGVKVYISGISGNKEVKKRQQRVTMILESKSISYSVIDITEPGKESDKEFMQQNSKSRESKHPLPPQIFNDETYCGDYEDFDMANELDELEKFLKVPPGEGNPANGHLANGNTSSREPEAAAVNDEEKMNAEDTKTNDEPTETEHQEDTAGEE